MIVEIQEETTIGRYILEKGDIVEFKIVESAVPYVVEDTDGGEPAQFSTLEFAKKHADEYHAFWVNHKHVNYKHAWVYMEHDPETIIYSTNPEMTGHKKDIHAFE